MCRARPGPAKSRRAVGETVPASTWRGGAPDRGPASSALAGGSLPICLPRPVSRATCRRDERASSRQRMVPL
ncbi:hypothetical protein VFPBJ_08966 [Purpureocillium lilacinum]|uniref:Uncharacterized protein n=1 Tax=Purpureocillium lilacinum TaxID=33203 RepID=A0A179GFJ9_PURLI|nr:hypothetical protein VFPBJ_08966 [Purpureocillium lilacinum]